MNKRGRKAAERAAMGCLRVNARGEDAERLCISA